MITTVWPSTVLPPAPLWQPYTVEHDTAAIRTAMDVGRPRARQRFGNRLTKVSVTWLMTGDQIEFFASWFATTARSGAAWVQIPLRIGMSADLQTCRFVGPYRQEPVGTDAWRVTAQLEVKSAQPLSADSVDVIVAFDGAASLFATRDVLADARLSPAFASWAVGFHA